ncbi:3-oxoacyl-[acyl-carrier-protein] reductase FabG [Hartmannibacter diazotrophicus]|uniref:3-oxoacyl-[acyl-carrier-protein] reductase FabG n=1 Tax=Hartmannibacter diazotrophicus TaxID=1482074 RepID=A0A2C9D1D4_9HYPH|nr:SDR family NAD(P)-dependent oxidoreductase [Hartmannibacter diazotrophicus]SON54056.1 3-oxoacyl-[acyl-carrier-protein] reductase FabG [Hartmannibacter diazotrophicus]
MKTPGFIVVTGAGSGIGLALVEAALARGRSVLACDIRIDALAALDHPALTVRALDVRDGTAIRAAVDALPTEVAIAGLVTSAAVFKRVPFLELSEELWDTTIGVNLTGTLTACQAVLPRMRAQRSGSIVMLSSSLARTGSPTGGHYAATKGGILGLARSLALELAGEGIRVNVVSPGLTDTPQPRAHPGGAEAMAERAKSIPLGRIGHPDDIVEAIDFLIGDESSYVTGQDIRVNGGSQIS